jgi:hypothetical protein
LGRPALPVLIKALIATKSQVSWISAVTAGIASQKLEPHPGPVLEFILEEIIPMIYTDCIMAIVTTVEEIILDQVVKDPLPVLSRKNPVPHCLNILATRPPTADSSIILLAFKIEGIQLM